MALKLVTEPEEYPVTVDEIKRHLRVDFDDENEDVEAYLQAAIDTLEGPGGYLGRVLSPQTWDYFLDGFPKYGSAYPGAYIEIPLPPLIEVLGVYSTDSSGTETEVPTSDYTVDTSSEPGRLYMAAWPVSPPGMLNTARIRFRAGYQSADSPPVPNAPNGIKSAIKLLTGMLYENREPEVEPVKIEEDHMPFVVRALLRKHRVYVGFA